jgi:hypothetical protein
VDLYLGDEEDLEGYAIAGIANNRNTITLIQNVFRMFFSLLWSIYRFANTALVEAKRTREQVRDTRTGAYSLLALFF